VDVWALLRVFGRHRAMLVASVLMVGAGVLWVQEQVAPTYSATATLIVLTPNAGGAYSGPGPAPSPTPQVAPRLVNPYLAIDASSYVIARILTQVMSSQDVQAEMTARGTGAYTVATSGEEPAIQIVVTDQNSERVRTSLSTLIKRSEEELASRQKTTGAPAANWSYLAPVVVQKQPVETANKLKIMGGVGALGLVAALTLVLVVDALEAAIRRQWPEPRKHRAGGPAMGPVTAAVERHDAAR
jgi:capsular polysaccharide biosynthesis protein